MVIQKEHFYALLLYWNANDILALQAFWIIFKTIFWSRTTSLCCHIGFLSALSKTFTTGNLYEQITKLDDPLERLNSIMDWEMFRAKLTKVCQKDGYTKGGHPPIDVIIKFKASVLRRICNLSFDQLEYQINDRLSFMRFLGLGLNDKEPDSRMIWDFENTLTKTEVLEELFCMEKLESEDLITQKGTIIDATFVDVPKQHNSYDDNKKIKNGEIPEDWKKPENTAKFAQKGTDAHWAKKRIMEPILATRIM